MSEHEHHFADTANCEVIMQVERTNSCVLVENKLPDGSRVIVDSMNETVFALNAAAGAAWDACSIPTTLSSVAEDMRRSLDPAITEEFAEEAILQLQDKKLVNASILSSPATRRQFLATIGAVAVPVVVALTATEQKAYALFARSGPIGTHPEPLPIPPLPPPPPLPKPPLPKLPLPGH
jgi:hypothetical protein